jgi:ribosome biogenesis GTPase
MTRRRSVSNKTGLRTLSGAAPVINRTPDTAIMQMDSDIERLGFEPEYLDRIDPAALAGRKIARVVAVHRDSYMLGRGDGDCFAELEGKLRYGASSPVDLPAVGDWVIAAYYDDDRHAIIHQVLSRKSLLRRKTPGKKIDFQLIAANVDTAFIVQSLDGNFNIRRLERYLVMVREANISPVVLLSKSDLCGPSQIEERTVRVREHMKDLPVVPFSNTDGSGLEKIESRLAPRRTHCLLGSSGVGKTSLLNRLLGETRFQTKAVREGDGKGRHATTARQLIRLSSGAMMVDTPGMRELGNISVEKGIAETFDEIMALAQRCRFSDCTHENEKGCAVVAALAEGRLPEDRYRSYLKMRRESAFHEMSLLEKRKKDRAFGKMCKTVMKGKKNRR